MAKSEKRVTELDNIIKRLYEDNLSGKLTDERFIKFSRDYELEQENLRTTAEAIRKELARQEQKRSDTKNFIAATKKYTDLKSLDSTIIREFIDRIEISATNGQRGSRENDPPRKISIVYNFIGAFDFSTAPENNENQQTAKKTA